MKNKVLKYCLLGSLMLFLFFPIISGFFKSDWGDPLGGYSIPSQDTVLNVGSWFSGRYQEKKEAYTKENMPQRNFLVRMNQQIQFSLFSTTGLDYMLVGKEGCLFDYKGIHAHFGNDYVGNEKLKARMNSISYVSRELRKRNVELVIILAPEKTGYYRELFPSRYVEVQKKTNREGLLHYAKTGGFNLIDFQRYFLQQKSKAPYPLMGKTGIHWTHYGANIATDSVQRYLQKLLGYDTPKMVLKGIEEKDVISEDRDMENSVNLLFNIQSQKYGYPQFSWDTIGKRKIKTMVIGDSFYWQMRSEGIDNLFSNAMYMYYMAEAHYQDATPMIPIAQYDLENEIMKRELVFVICTEANLAELGWGFFERMEKWLKSHPQHKK